MFQLDIKRADVALASGRLEEACQLVQQPSVREHRDGQRLVDKLIEALLARVKLHIASDRMEDAHHDAELAFALGGRKSEVAAAMTQLKILQTKRIETAIAANDIELAVTALGALNEAQRTEPHIMRLLPLAIEPLANRGVDELAAGRLDRATTTDNLLASLRHHSSKSVELHDQLRRCLMVCEHLRSGRHAEAQRELSLLAQTLPNAQWIHKTQADLSQIVQSIANVWSGPIGLLALPARSIRDNSFKEFAAKLVNPQPRSIQWLLQVDGIGGLLVHCNTELSIGSAATSSRFDLPLQTDDLQCAMKLRRNGEDYFAEATVPFRVNEQHTTRRLLVSGDQVSVGQRVRFRFLKPVPASASAVLQLTSAGLARRDIRNVVLMADSLLFAQSGGHFCLADEAESIVVFRQGDALAVKRLSRFTQASAVQSLRVGESIVVGQTRFALASHSPR